MNRDISNNEDIDINNDIYNYKGYFVENADQDDEPKYFEFGAHFRYKDLYNALKILKKEQAYQKIKSENEEKLAQINTKKIENKERNNTRNKNMNIDNNIQNILKGFKSRIRSRNIGAEQQNENQNELTFIPFNHNKNNFSVKKDSKNSNSIIYVNKTNYTNIKNKNKNNNRKSLNSSNNYNLLNKKLNGKNANNDEKNNNIFMNKKFQKNILNQMDKHKLSDKNIFSRNQGPNNLYKQVKVPPNNKTTNQNNNILNNMNFYKSYKIQISHLNKNNDRQKLFNFDESSFNYYSKDNKDKAKYNYNFKNDQKMFQKNISNLTEPKFLYNSLNKNISDMKGKYLKLDKIKNYNLYNINKKSNVTKERGKPASSNLDNILNSYRAKKLKFSPEKETVKFMPNDTGKSPTTYQFNNLTRFNKNNKRISLKKNKFNDYSDYLNNRGIISVSMDNNKYISNNITIEKAKNNNRKYENSNIVHISLINQSNNNKSEITFPELLNNNDFGKNYINSNLNCEKIKNKSNKNKREDLINYNQFNKINNINNNININKDNDLFNLLDKNEMYSRNKNNNYFLNNISSINFTNKKTINTTNNNNKNNNNLKKMNMTQQNHAKLLQNKNHKIQIRNKMLNFHNNLMNNNYNKNFKKNMIEISSTSKKKIFTSSNDDNIMNDNYKIELMNKKIHNNKSNYSYLNNLKINKSKKKISLTKHVANTIIAKENTYNKNKLINKSYISNEVSANKSNISNNVNQLNEAKNKSWGIKKYESLIKKKPHKNNININININNNNKIIYNKIFNNKNHGLNTNPKGVKSPTLQKIRSYINNTTLEMKSNNNNKKANYTNLQFPKAKLLNVYNSNNK